MGERTWFLRMVGGPGKERRWNFVLVFPPPSCQVHDSRRAMRSPSVVSMMKGALNGPLSPAELTAATSNM